MKPLRLLETLVRSPTEFCERVVAITDGYREALARRPVYLEQELENVSKSLGSALQSDVVARLGDAQLADVDRQVNERQKQLPLDAPFARFHNGDVLLSRLCYAVVRCLKPAFVVETGVCYGVTSAYLLKGLEANQKGHLHSIDLPLLGKNTHSYVGWMVPDELRPRWTLHRGSSRRLLEPLLDNLGSIDLFVHDSLHTYRNMTQEFRRAWPALRPGGVLISDDLESNSAFLDLSARQDVAFSSVMKEHDKDSLLGIAVKGG